MSKYIETDGTASVRTPIAIIIGRKVSRLVCKERVAPLHFEITRNSQAIYQADALIIAHNPSRL